MEIVGLEVSGFLELVWVDLAGVRIGRPAMEAWIMDEGAWRCVPGPGL